MERVKGIEPSSQAWEAHILPLNHTRLRITLLTPVTPSVLPDRRDAGNLLLSRCLYRGGTEIDGPAFSGAQFRNGWSLAASSAGRRLGFSSRLVQQ